MSDESAEIQGTPVPEETGEAAQTEDSATSAPEEGTQEDSPAPPKPKGVQKRIDELTSNWRSAERDRDYWREVALKGGPKPEPQAPTPEATGKPRVDDFETYDTYLEALSDWKVDQRLQASRDEQKQAEQQRSLQERQATFEQRAQAIRAQHSDFDSVVQNPALPISDAMAEAAFASEMGPQLLYHLGQHPDEAMRIYRMSPYEAAMEMGRLETKLSRPARTQTNAPDPISPVAGGGGGNTADPTKMTAEEYRDWRNKTSRLMPRNRK